MFKSFSGNITLKLGATNQYVCYCTIIGIIRDPRIRSIWGKKSASLTCILRSLQWSKGTSLAQKTTILPNWFCMRGQACQSEISSQSEAWTAITILQYWHRLLIGLCGRSVRRNVRLYWFCMNLGIVHLFPFSMATSYELPCLRTCTREEHRKASA